MPTGKPIPQPKYGSLHRIDNALASEEFNKMQNMLEPLSLVSFNFKFHIFPRTEAE